MVQRILILLIFVAIFQYGYSQNTSELFMTKSYRNALDSQSRSTTGSPGKNYWQNRTDYQIKATFDTDSRTIKGYENIHYSNNSPDTLHRIYFDLIQDIFKKGTSRDWDLGPVDLHDGVIIKSLIIDGISYDINSRLINRRSSKMSVFLMQKFNPRSQHTIEVKWEVTLSHIRNVRMGTYNNTNFMVAYWFPKVAVYDDLWGWAREPHKGNCEYYHEFGNYQVELKMPPGFALWATGMLQNGNKIYTKDIQQRILEATQSDKIIPVITAMDYKTDNIFQSKDSTVWKFSASDVPDFAFAASNSYIWDATSTQSGDRRVLINAVYKTNSADFRKVADVSKKSIDYFTHESPQIEFPYPQLTVFNGRGGMEFPAMVNDGDSKDFTSTLFVTSHEIGHSYFPFNTGLNEQLYAWMDEGLISFFPRGIIAKYTDDTNYVVYSDLISNYNSVAGSIREIPLMIPSTNTGFSYRYQAYIRSATAFYTLNEYLGTQKFNQALQVFSKRWEHKHPIPYDFFNTFNEVAGEDLGWFWKPWFFDLDYADLALKIVNEKELIIQKKGGLPVPIHLSILFEDGSIDTFDEPASVWKEGRSSYKLSLEKPFVKLELDTQLTPDAYPSDNIWVKDVKSDNE